MSDRIRARDLPIPLGSLPAGARCSIVDVPGVRVGHATVDDGCDVHTGVTAVLPDALTEAGGRVRAGLFVGNGYGKLTGVTQLTELGELESPVLLTGTLSAFRAADAALTYLMQLPGNERVQSFNPVVGETNDGYLSDIRSRPITEQHVLSAIRDASADVVAEGCVGAGTGTAALGFKGGIGTASRRVTVAGTECTLGVLVQSNFSGTLTVCGVPVTAETALGDAADNTAPQGNSCMIVVATDAGLDARQLRRVATRAVFGLARVGSDFAQGSGDYAIAFDTADFAALPDATLNPILLAAQEAVEEATLNSLFMARTTTGMGHVRHAVPIDVVMARLRAAGVLSGP